MSLKKSDLQYVVCTSTQQLFDRAEQSLWPWDGVNAFSTTLLASLDSAAIRISDPSPKDAQAR